MHYCEAKLKIAGDNRTIVVRDSFRPISWPEIDVLRALHGEDAVMDVKPFVHVERSAKDEKERLRQIYGPVVEDIYPGRNPQMEMDAAGAKLPEQIPLWRDPMDKDPLAEEKPAPAEKPTKAKAAAPFA